jgi:glycosyltransferase involved in cell wall biosynthesis
MEQKKRFDFSVILPVYNAEVYLIDTLESISNINYSSFEVIIINDGSTDKSKDICLGFCEKFNHFKYYENDINIGLIKSLNRALLIANGKYLVRADADDLFDNSILKDYLKIINTLDHKSNFVLSSKSFYLKEEKIVKPIFRYSVLNKNIKKILLLENQINHPSSCFPNHKKNNILYGDENKVKYFEDFDLWIRMVGMGYNIISTDRRYLYYRVHDESITGKFNFEKSILKESYLSKSELKDFFSLNEISLIAGKKEVKISSFFTFEHNLIKYIDTKGDDLDLKAWLLFYLLNLYKKTHTSLSFVNKINLLIIILKNLISNIFNTFIYRHFWK